MNDATLKITPHEHVRILEETTELLAVEVTWGEPGSAPPKHFHPQQDEHFEVISGRLTTKLDGNERTLGPGETLDIPRRTVHQMWNAGPDPVVARWETRPAGRTGDWFRALDRQHREGNVGKNGMPPLPLMAKLLSEYDDVFQLATVPKPLLGVLGKFARV